MAKRGRKAKPPSWKVMTGTDQPCRATELVHEPVDDAPELPPSFADLRKEDPLFADKVLALWNRKTARYERRGQPIADYLDLLYVVCLFEAQIHEKRRTGQPITAADVNALRVAHEAFYDTPTANVQPAKGLRRENPFAEFMNIKD